MSEIASKEIIKSRMIKNAADFWGYADGDIDAFDPIARMLIEACSIELYKVSNEISDSNVRMLEKLANLLTPEVLVGPKPAHALIHASPNDVRFQIYPNFQFYFPKKFAAKADGPEDSVTNIFFSPVSRFNLFNGSIKFICTGSNVFSIKENAFKEHFLKTAPGKKFESSTVWIGLQLHHKVDTTDGISLLFDWKNLSGSYNYYQLLPLTKWTVNNLQLETAHGMKDKVNGSADEYDDDILSRNDDTRLFEKQIYDFYNQRFITLLSTPGGRITEDDKEKYPQNFKELLSEKELTKFTEPLLWIKISFPSVFTEFVLDDLLVSINCFPVMNRKLTEVRYRLQENINIIPLTTEDQFMSVKSVRDMEGKEYHSNPVTESKADEPGTYTLREGGITRFDSKNASEYISYLLELLRDESVSFSALNRDFISTHITTINQNISIIEQKLGQSISEIKNMPAFILLKPRKEGETIYVEYWTTNGEHANTLRAGSKLKIQGGSDIRQESIALVTSSMGGRNKIPANKKLFAYKNAIMTKGRIVTTQDIKTFCFSELGDKISEVEIKKGLVAGIKPEDGIIKTIDIHLTPSNKELSDEEWNMVVYELQWKLENKSSLLNKYRIFIEH